MKKSKPFVFKMVCYRKCNGFITLNTTILEDDDAARFGTRCAYSPAGPRTRRSQDGGTMFSGAGETTTPSRVTTDGSGCSQPQS